MTRSREKQELVDEFIERLQGLLPYSVSAETVDEKPAGADAWVRIRVPSAQYVTDLLLKAAALQTEWYIDKGIYIVVSASSSGPIKFSRKT